MDYPLNGGKENTSEKSESIDSLMKLSVNYYYNNLDYGLVFDNSIKKALDLAKMHNNQKKIGEIYNELGKRYRNNSEFNRAIWYHQKAADIATLYGLDTLLANSTYKQSVVFRQMDDNPQSYKLCMKALVKAEYIKDTFLIHCSLNGIGNVYFNHQNYKEAIRYFKKSLDYLNFKGNHNYLGEAMNNNTLGEAWLFSGNTDSAFYYLQKSFEINVKIKSKLGQAICYNGMSLVYLEQKKYKEAIETSKKAIFIDSKKINLLYRAMFKNTLGRIYLEADSLNLSEKYLREAFKISSKIGNKRESLIASEYLIKLFTELKDYKKMMFYTQKWIAYKDSITKNLITQNSNAMNMLYKSEQQQREILILKQNAELTIVKMNKQRILLIFIFTLFAGVLIFIYFFYRHRKLQGRLNEIALEQRLLRSQLNPHFIFNSLSAMQSFIIRNDALLASDYLARFSSLMRNVLEGSRTEYILLDTEIETIDNYLKLQQLRFSDKFVYRIYVDEKIDNDVVLIPSMIIQPFVENSIEHGMKDPNFTYEIKVSIQKKEDYLFIYIDDNGVGVEQKEIKNNHSKKHKSLATTIIRERLSVITAKTKKKCNLTIINKKEQNSEDRGVLVVIEIPIVEEEG